MKSHRLSFQRILWWLQKLRRLPRLPCWIHLPLAHQFFLAQSMNLEPLLADHKIPPEADPKAVHYQYYPHDQRLSLQDASSDQKALPQIAQSQLFCEALKILVSFFVQDWKHL